MTTIFNKHASMNSVLGWKAAIPASVFAGTIDQKRIAPHSGLMCPVSPIDRHNMSVDSHRNGINKEFMADMATLSLNTVDNLASLSGPFWTGKNNALYMDVFKTEKYLKFSPGGINMLKNSGGIKRSANLAKTNINGPINAINSFFNKPVFNLKVTKYSWFGKQELEPFTRGAAVSYAAFGLTAYDSLNYIFNYQGNNHTKDGVDLIFGLIGFLGPLGAAYSLTYSGIDRYYPGGVTGYARDVKGFFTDLTGYVGNKMNNTMTEFGKRESNNFRLKW